MDPVTALSQTFDHMHRVVGGVSADQLGNSTPCTEWDVRALLDHAYGVVSGIGAATAGSESSAVELDESDLAGQFRAIADRALEAWRRDGAFDDEMDAGAGPMPGMQYAAINTIDTLTHSWDLARATGQDAELPEELATHTLAICQHVITPAARQFAGFDPAIDVPVAASATDQLVAFLGRKP